MESSSFYITLPSNASMVFYPTNTASNYQIRMPRTFYLQGKYEVALAEIQYPHTWTTMREGIDFIVSYRQTDTPRHQHLHVPNGYYNNIGELCDVITDKLDENISNETKPIALRFNKITGRVHLKMMDNYEVFFSDGIAEMLGFIPGEIYRNKDIGEHKADVKHGFYTMFVYCSLCEPQVVGDHYVPLLRNVNIAGRDGDVILKTYGEPHYVPVNTSKFDTIEINIKDDTGHNVSFESGKVVCKLHFRQKAL